MSRLHNPLKLLGATEADLSEQKLTGKQCIFLRVVLNKNDDKESTSPILTLHGVTLCM